MTVQFSEEENFNQTFRAQSSSTTGLTAWFIKKGWAKDENAAKNLMTVISIVCFSLAIYFAIK